MKLLHFPPLLLMIGVLSTSFVSGAQPDLVTLNVSAPTEAVSDRSISVSWTVKNGGDGVAAASWYDQIYWSTNDTWEATDTAMGTVTQGQAIAPGSNYVATSSFTVPKVPPGTYYLIARADAYSYLFETDEANNTVVRTIVVTPGSGFPITAVEMLPNGRIRLAFPTSGGLAYGLESTTSLQAASWQPQAFYGAANSAASLTTITGTGAELSVYVVPAGDHRFYRAVAH